MLMFTTVTIVSVYAAFYEGFSMTVGIYSIYKGIRRQTGTTKRSRK
ncbi:hypothetical protein [[Clostridium] fimetarium]|uniref:Uncharacterized protein n=1 Tax=[Clostridium] fimetarium TaxID=99656 RepID=A0A1I0MYD3_9FIRM|nr:hypothetical protein [[Clostridium] fimetarium]SEV93656.1 hypothetical protein SAMN05421659_102241 [[Clostridium] fimetarium]